MSPVVDDRSAPPLQHSLLLFAVFVIVGMVLGKLMRMALDDAVGPEAGLADRLAGAALGAARVGLVAITLVVVFDQLVPPDRQPAYSPVRSCVRYCRKPGSAVFDRCRQSFRPQSIG